MKLHISLLCVSLVSLQSARGMEYVPATDHQLLCTAFLKRDSRAIEKFIDKATDLNQEILFVDPGNPAGDNLRMVTPLDLACEFQMPAIISELRARGVSVSQADEKGDTPLARVLARGTHNQEVIAFLITEDTINRQNDALDSPLHIIMQQKYVNPEVLKLLCRQGGRIDLQDNAGNSPLHYAVLRDGTGRLLKILLKALPKEEELEIVPAQNEQDAIEKVPLSLVDVQNKGGATPLHLAIVRYLEAKDTDRHLTTAQHLKTIENLLEAGASLGVKNIQGISPLDLILNLLPHGDQRARELDAFLKQWAERPSKQPSLLDKVTAFFS